MTAIESLEAHFNESLRIKIISIDRLVILSGKLQNSKHFGEEKDLPSILERTFACS